MGNAERIIEIITADSERVAVLRAVASLGLPEAWIAGGYIRNPVWDVVCQASEKNSGTDIDVVYFRPLDDYGISEEELIARIRADEMNPVWEEEEAARKKLEQMIPGLEYEVKNQARMYFSSARTVQHKQYRSLSEAVSGWVETATATGVRLNNDGSYSVLAPYGTEDLFAGIIRPTNSTSEYKERAHKRAEKKGWLKRWPTLRFADPL